MFYSVCLLALVATAFALPQIRDLHGSRIVNGNDAPPGKYPSAVSLQRASHSCGATIINENWVLTAAHCVDGSSPSSINILAGTVTLDNGGSMHPASEIIVHGAYDPVTIRNDIAVVKVSVPFVWNDMVQPVTLPPEGQDSPSGSNATIIGWGYPYSDGEVMNHLQEVNLWVLSDKECDDLHWIWNEIFSTNICAYYPGGGKGQCSGDSGGPMFVNGYQAGIVSWSIPPCEEGPYPGVSTEVSAYINWINSNVN